MPIYHVKGNLLDSTCDYICHQVNCQGVMGSGVAKQIKEMWPEVYEYYKKNVDPIIDKSQLLGDIEIVGTEDGHNIINMFGQDEYGYNGRRYTSYDAFWMCLCKIARSLPDGETIAFPYKIGSDRGGANWNVILAMIKEALSEDHEVYIYKLED